MCFNDELEDLESVESDGHLGEASRDCKIITIARLINCRSCYIRLV